MRPYTYLALGDSYTIGEAVPLNKNFPYQAVQLLRQQGISITAPEIIAKTGWTTSELLLAIEETKCLPQYTIVSLLAGVNNQYRGLPLQEYEKEMRQLLHLAIEFAGGVSNQVFVFSIPDYSSTPFAQKMDTKKIENEIDAFNDCNKKLAGDCNTNYINITEEGRESKWNKDLIAADGLHPSEIEYARWAHRLENEIRKCVIF